MSAIKLILNGGTGIEACYACKLATEVFEHILVRSAHAAAPHPLSPSPQGGSASLAFPETAA